jgi:ATP-binding cassette subfamily B multidrug efflux pump
VIAIAHRLSTIARMDRLVVLENGKIAESGTHAELLAHRGLYARLWAHQTGGFVGID